MYFVMLDVLCKKCRSSQTFYVPYGRQPTSYAIRQGWFFDNGKWFCPECKQGIDNRDYVKE